jgi:hypothetical protein
MELGVLPRRLDQPEEAIADVELGVAETPFVPLSGPARMQAEDALDGGNPLPAVAPTEDHVIKSPDERHAAVLLEGGLPSQVTIGERSDAVGGCDLPIPDRAA